MTETIAQTRPFVVTFRALAFALAPLHYWERRYVDTLHDVWKRGAPTPDSRLLVPERWDERQAQPGNIERRILSPLWVAAWVRDVSAARGMALDWRQCVNLIEGRADYGVDLHHEALITRRGT